MHLLPDNKVYFITRFSTKVFGGTKINEWTFVASGRVQLLTDVLIRSKDNCIPLGNLPLNLKILWSFSGRTGEFEVIPDRHLCLLL